ncbi:SubName: Full=Uncharacterized protein {ECO:0000313/EMBL:CCA74453.1} [Serendipita indica DSM 11827]|uniref:RNA polymerase Rpb4/RPC9 core domain-containing protein n=1 Tax=Serendipita indica (strain DSM 11827) TaxID=1109443 RepID=G4TT07_SERID|nr:SubName: Full=Uncharacterized protein {ECO:0000313/EMBL:CCA74453.1} [Serendipita indica DSM 11827]CCA74453.1 hypothetical protein PIIN_08406 [Serendipita indica DSM 11827]
MTTRLGRRTHLEEEDAATLKLGAEFNNAGCLLISEVKILLKEKEGKPGVDSPVFNKTVEYVNMFSKFSTEDTIGLVRATLRRQANLTQFETAQLANLCPSTAEEAKSIIPSLAKYDDDELQPLLDELQSMRRFQD